MEWDGLIDRPGNELRNEIWLAPGRKISFHLVLFRALDIIGGRPGPPTHQTTNQPNDQPTNQATNQPNNQPTNQTTNQPTNQTTNQPTKQPTKQPNNQPNNQTTKQPNNQTTKQPTKRFAISLHLEVRKRTSEPPRRFEPFGHCDNRQQYEIRSN